MTRPPLGLSVNIRDPSGAVTQLHVDAINPEDVPRNLTFGSQRMTGFSTCSFDLARRIDVDYPDLNLLHEVEVVSDDGSTVWEGRIGALPRSATSDGKYTVGVQCAGWMAHARDRKFVAIFVDRDVNQWGDTPRERKLAYAVANTSIGELTYTAQQGGLTCSLPNQALGAQVAGEVWYQAPPGLRVGKASYRGSTISFPAGWTQQFYATDARSGTPGTLASPTLDDTLRTTALAATRYVFHQIYSSATAATPAAGAVLQFSKLAVYGDHGIALTTGDPTEPDGITASAMLRYIFDTYCPKLNTAGIEGTTFAIPHQTFREPTFPYDAIADVNKHHLWDCSVWEGKTVHYTGTDLTDYDWDVRLDDPGTSTTLQGDSVEDLANGIVITFTDLLTGEVMRLTPDDYPELRDSHPENPANLAGYPVWTEQTLSAPAMIGSALQMGRVLLAEFNAPKAPGDIIAGPYVRDRAGHWQSYAKVRAGDRVAITSSTSLSDRPRVIQSAEQSQSPYGGGQVTMHIDSTSRTMEALFDRLSSALAANGLI